MRSKAFHRVEFDFLRRSAQSVTRFSIGAIPDYPGQIFNGVPLFFLHRLCTSRDPKDAKRTRAARGPWTALTLPPKRLRHALHRKRRAEKDGFPPLGIPCAEGAPRKRESKGGNEGGGGAARDVLPLPEHLSNDVLHLKGLFDGVHESIANEVAW